MAVHAQAFDQRGLKAIYYKTADYEDSIILRRDAVINFNRKTPDSGIPDSVKNFSMKWFGYIVPRYSEKYNICIQSSGALSVWLNDSLFADKHGIGNTTTKIIITLTKGIQYSLKVQCSNSPVVKLVWQSKHQKKEIIPASQLIPEGAELPPIRVMMNVIGRDPEVTPGPDGMYYMVHTSCYLGNKLAHKNCWDNNDGLRLWKSADLKNWTDLGLIWGIDKDGSWQKEYDAKGRRPLWAPEIHYISKMRNWFMVYSMGTFDPLGIRTGLMKSTSGKPEGPYKDVVNGPITEGIDGSLFEEDGKVYFLRNNCLIALMNNDMTGFAEPFRSLKTYSGKDVGFEGSGMFKYKGKYYLYSAKGNTDMGKETYDLNIAVANNIYGPYSDSWLALRHGGHSTIFNDKKGNIWATMFGSDDVSNVYITPSIARLKLEYNGKILAVRGRARAKVILPSQQIKAVSWKYTFNKPAENWASRTADDRGWQNGPGGFGFKGNTPWDTNDIWLRKVVNTGQLSPAMVENMVLSVSHNADVEIYINGIMACEMTGFNKYSLKKISDRAKLSLKNHKQTIIAIHCQKDGSGQFIDAGLITWTDF
jgi:hypothetical protein